MNNEMGAFEPIEQLLEHVNVNSVFGTPTEAGSITMIPVAEVNMMFGYGFGSDSGSKPDSAGAGPSGGAANMGGGGGGGGRARPVGFIRVAPDGVQFEPLVDIPRLGLAGILLAGWMVFWTAQTIMALRRGR